MIMQYQKMVNLSDSTSNQTLKCRTRNQIEVNVELGATNSTNSQIKLKTSIIR